jgi:hypothetical protein
VDNEATDIEKAKCAKHVKQEKTLAIWIGQLNTKIITKINEVIKERVAIIFKYSPVYYHCFKCSSNMFLFCNYHKNVL